MKCEFWEGTYLVKQHSLTLSIKNDEESEESRKADPAVKSRRPTYG